MKILGKDGKEYESVEKCLEADRAFEEAQKAKEIEEGNKKNAASKRKKELADAVKESDNKVRQAEESYEKSKTEANRIIKEANEKAREILTEGLNGVEAATKERTKAIQTFNNEFGPYMISYTGDAASKEYARWMREVDNILRFFKW